jgi:hypothetical protein
MRHKNDKDLVCSYGFKSHVEKTLLCEADKIEPNLLTARIHDRFRYQFCKLKNLKISCLFHRMGCWCFVNLYHSYCYLKICSFGVFYVRSLGNKNIIIKIFHSSLLARGILLVRNVTYYNYCIHKFFLTCPTFYLLPFNPNMKKTPKSNW